MLVRFKQSLIVDNHNHVEGDTATLHDERAKRLIQEGAVELHVPDVEPEPGGEPHVKREAVANPKTRKAVQDV